MFLLTLFGSLVVFFLFIFWLGGFGDEPPKRDLYFKRPTIAAAIFLKNFERYKKGAKLLTTDDLKKISEDKSEGK